ncbi:hypothetical protein KKI93_13025 [Xenorhabdus bovienii]|uniref:hypothetical protein n=1 Tax=Xenorhabdus bovienii TaxID=40576 RepID=UPI0023B20DF3|nr:hypothetical protein [Xenorhabdus bovienii]MDE9564959.1 hypothetical protein [Xenorhabdus bovienii]
MLFKVYPTEGTNRNEWHDTYCKLCNEDETRCDKNETKGYNPVISDTVGPQKSVSTFQIAKYTSTCWNETGFIEKNNCYSYACNIFLRKDAYGIPDPGYRKYRQLVSSRSELLAGIKYDGLIEIIDGSGTTPIVKGEKDNPAWIVALFDGSDNNGNYGYHFFRKVWSGIGKNCGENGTECYWAHKFFTGRVTNKTYDGSSFITDPEIEMKNINKNGKNGIKYDFVGYFLVSTNVEIGAGNM